MLKVNFTMFIYDFSKEFQSFLSSWLDNVTMEFIFHANRIAYICAAAIYPPELTFSAKGRE